MLVAIRDFKPGDEKVYAKIWNEANERCSWFLKHGPANISYITDTIERRKQASGYRLLFALVDNVPIGFIEATAHEKVGLIGLYQPSVLPEFQHQGIEELLVKEALKHFRRHGSQTARFSIMGSQEDVAPFLELYQGMGFKIWRHAYLMRRSLEDIPEYESMEKVKFLTAESLGLDTFADFYMKCFKDSLDRDAAQAASSCSNAKRLIEGRRKQERESHDPAGWFAAFLDDEFTGFAIAIKGEEGGGFIAEVGVTPKFRRKGFGRLLTTKALKRLKQRGYEYAHLGVDAENTPAVSLYRTMGFKISRQMYQLELNLE